MAELIGMPRATWRRQPTSLVGLNFAHPLNRNVVSFVSAHGKKDFVSGKTIVLNSGISRSVDKTGYIYQGNSGSNSQIDIGAPSDFRSLLTNYTDYTVVLSLYVSNYTNRQFYISDANSVGGSYSVHCEVNGSQIIFRYQMDGTGMVISYPISSDGYYHLVAPASYRTYSFYINGEYFNNYTIFTGTGEIQAGTALRLASAGLYPSLGWRGKVLYAGIFNRTFDAAEVKEIYKNPWQLFRSAPSRFILIPSGNVGSSVLINMPRAVWKRQPQSVTLKNYRLVAEGSLLFKGGDGVTYSGSSIRATQQDGVVDAFDGTADYRELVAPEASNPTKSSCVVRFRVNAAPSGDSGAVVSRHHAGELIWIGSSGVLAVFDTTTGWIYGGLPAEYGLGRWMTVAFSVESNVRMKGWVDGHLFCDVAIGEIGQYIAFPFWLGRVAYTGVSGYLNCSISCVYYTESIVPDSLLSDFSSNPWQLFRPAPSRFILIPSSGGVFSLIVQDCAVANTFDAPFLTQAHVLALADVLHVSTIDQPSLSSAYALTLAAAVHNVVVDTPNLTQSNTLTVVETNQDVVVDTPNLTQSQIIEIAKINQDVIIDGLTLTQAHVLTLENTLHGVLSEELTLAVAGSLIIADSSHSIEIDVPAFTQSNTITVSDTSQSTTIDGALGLTQAFVVSVADTAQSLSFDIPTLSTELNLTVSDGVSSVTLDVPVLTQAQTLVLAELLHSTTVDSFVLGQGFTLVVADTAQEVVYDTPVLTQSFVLSVLDALHNQVFDALNLVTYITLVVSDVLCAVLVGTASEISLTPQSRVFLVQAEDRLFVIFPEDRTFGVS